MSFGNVYGDSGTGYSSNSGRSAAGNIGCEKHSKVKGFVSNAEQRATVSSECLCTGENPTSLTTCDRGYKDVSKEGNTTVYSTVRGNVTSYCVERTTSEGICTLNDDGLGYGDNCACDPAKPATFPHPGQLRTHEDVVEFAAGGPTTMMDTDCGSCDG